MFVDEIRGFRESLAMNRSSAKNDDATQSDIGMEQRS